MDKTQQQPQDDFGAFLSSMNRAMKEEKSSKSQTSIRIVRYLSHNSDARIETIMMHVRSSFTDFTQGLNELNEAGLVEVDDDEAGTVIELTDEGQRWAQTIIDHDDDGEEL
jgi:predicted transcriptional regulator